MYERLLSREIAGRRYADRPALILEHEEATDSFLEKYRTAASEALKGSSESKREFCAHMIDVVSDERMLMTAYIKMQNRRLGLSNQWYESLTSRTPELWSFLRKCRDVLRSGNYQIGSERRVTLPKEDGMGRTLQIQVKPDRLIASALSLVLEPWFDPSFGDRSWGFRRGRSAAWGAIAQAIAISDNERRYVWIVQDLKAAFDRVPHRPLLDILRKRLFDDSPLLELVEKCITNSKRRGIRQGNPLSPLLLNIFLSHLLDHRWSYDSRNPPLVRYADDFVLLCASKAQAIDADKLLRSRLRGIGMGLKHDADLSICPVRRAKQPLTWLGFAINRVTRSGKQEWVLKPASDYLAKLQAKFDDLHRGSDAPLLAQALVRGWLNYYAPCYPHVNRTEMLAEIRALASSASFDSLPSDQTLCKRWEKRYCYWLELLQETRQLEQLANPT